MCWITKKAHQKAMGALRKEIDELALDLTSLSYSHDLTIEAYDRCTSELTQIKNELFPTTPPAPDIFDPKAEEYPTELAGMKLGFVTVKLTANGKKPHLMRVLADNSLDAYENHSWGTNSDVRRVMVNPDRKAVAVESPPDIPENKTKLYRSNGKPFAWVFDSGAAAYRVCPKQIINGHDLSDLPPLYLKVEDVKEVVN